jgi:hypothetical protein
VTRYQRERPFPILLQAAALRAEDALKKERAEWAAARLSLLEDKSGTAADRDRWMAEAHLAAKAADDAQVRRQQWCLLHRNQ